MRQFGVSAKIGSFKFCLCEVQLVNHTQVITDHVKLAVTIATEGHDFRGTDSNLTNRLQITMPLCNTPKALRFVITTDVNAVERGAPPGSIHVTSGHGRPMGPPEGDDGRNVLLVLLPVHRG